jgi:hypothetical protein
MFDKDRAPTQETVDKFVYLSPMLDSALSEMREFSKKKQDGIVSATKIKILNRLLSDIRGILENEDSVAYLEPLSEDELPQNSDAVLILGQYGAALKSFKDAHYDYVGGSHRWITREWIEEYELEHEGEYEPDEEEEFEGTDEDPDSQ